MMHKNTIQQEPSKLKRFYQTGNKALQKIICVAAIVWVVCVILHFLMVLAGVGDLAIFAKVFSQTASHTYGSTLKVLKILDLLQKKSRK